MEKDLLNIIKHYGALPQLKYFQSEVFELTEAIIKWENYDNEDSEYWEEDYKRHIAEEIADIQVMLDQFQHYYGITDEEIWETMKYKVKRQLERIEKENEL